MSHRSASIGVRERLARPGARARWFETACREAALAHAFALVTCNRLECWGLAPAPPPVDAASRLAACHSLEDGALKVRCGPEAYRHAIRVASGLDSAVWGEPQIAGQVLAAARASRGEAAAASLDSTVRRVLQAARSVRRTAGLGPSARGAPEAAADLLERRLGARRGRVLVVGAGLVGRRTAQRSARFATVTVADRNLDKAKRAAARSGGRAVELVVGLSALARFDAAVVALSAPEATITRTHIGQARRPERGSFLIIDLSFPRAVAAAVGRAPRVDLVDVDGLAREEERARPGAAASLAEAAASEWAHALHRERRARRAGAAVAQLRSRAEAIRREELERARERMTGDPRADAAVLDKLTDRLVNRLLHDPTEGLRALWANDEPEAVHRVARQLFRLEGPP